MWKSEELTLSRGLYEFALVGVRVTWKASGNGAIAAVFAGKITRTE